MWGANEVSPLRSVEVAEVDRALVAPPPLRRPAIVWCRSRQYRKHVLG